MTIDAARIRKVMEQLDALRFANARSGQAILFRGGRDSGLGDAAALLEALLRDIDAQGAANGVDPQFQAGFDAGYGQGQFDAAQTDTQGAASAVWRLVPVEPTDAMKRAGNEALGPWIAPVMNSNSAYRAMLAAAPPSPALHAPTVEACAKVADDVGAGYAGHCIRALTSGAEAEPRPVPAKANFLGGVTFPPPTPAADAGEVERLTRKEAERRFGSHEMVIAACKRSAFTQGALWLAALRPAPTEEQVERAREFVAIPEDMLTLRQRRWAALHPDEARAILAVGPAPQAGAGR
jgi:hypothetical protein